MPLILLVIVVIVLAWMWERGKQQKRDEQWELRYPTLDAEHPDGDTFSGKRFVDFEKMLFVDEREDYCYAHTRVFQLRRRDGPIWEINEEAESRKRSWAHLQAARKRGPGFLRNYDEEEADLKDWETWHPIQFPTLEAAYQRFLLHYRPTTVFAASPADLAVARDFVEGTPRPSRAASR